ncbi:MAG: hypothetical protein ACJ780_31485 [Solirubrobacteraceae bacterium]|jgi:hypothetical protein
MTIPVLGRPEGTNNPLVVLNEHLGNITAALRRLSGPDLPHDYAVGVAEDPGGHGKMWGAYCLACSDEVRSFVYPCQRAPEEAVKPPQFFTIGDVFIITEDGAMARYEPPKT